MKHSFPIECFTVFLDGISIDEVSGKIVSELKSYFGNSQVESYSFNGRVEYANVAKSDILNYVGILFMSPVNRIIYTDNTGEGYPSLIYNLCQKNQYRVVSCRIYEDEDFPGYFFTYYDGSKIERTVYSYKDEKEWSFFSRGPLQWFENKLYYSLRQKKQRLNGEIIKEYLKKLGIEIADPNIWNSIVNGFCIVRKHR
jgi:hypothetical protein